MGRFRISQEVELAGLLATKITGAVALASTVWLLYGFFSGHTSSIKAQFDPLAFQHAVGVIRITGTVVLFSSCIFVTLFGIITYRSRDVVLLIGFLGIVCILGLPALIQYRVARDVGRTMTESEHWMSTVFTHVGSFILIVAVIRGVIHLAESASSFGQSLMSNASVGIEEKASRNSIMAKNPTMFTPCWKLPYCRDGIREVCPAFIAKKTCWKFGKGCYCDDEMITRIITADPTVSRRGGAFMQAMLQDIKKAAAKKKGDRPPCDRCYIYIEHQRLKHKLISPITLPLTVGLMYLCYPVYQSAFRSIAGVIIRAWSVVSYSPETLPPDQISWLGSMETMFGIVTGFFVLVYLTKGLEFAIFKLRW